MLIFFNIVRFALSWENEECRGRHNVFFHDGVCVGDKEEMWIAAAVWLTVFAIFAIIAAVIVYLCR